MQPDSRPRARRVEPRSGRPRLQAVYSVAELARLTGKTRWATRTMLDSLGVKWLTEDPRTVTLAEIKRVAPDLWESFALVQALSECG